MAISWLTALKAVPWAEVVQAAPGIVQGARKLISAAKSYGAAPGAPRAAPPPDALAERLRRVEAGIETLQGEQRATAELIRSLAEQNATIVAALDVLRSRMRLLVGACIVLGIACGALIIAFVAR